MAKTRKIVLGSAILVVASAAAYLAYWLVTTREIVDVYPGESIQAALEAAAKRRSKPIIRVHEGTYRPDRPGQALIHFNARHDGIILEGVGNVVFTAANPDLADPKAKSYPAIVNHVVYFGDGISRDTVLRNVTVTGGNAYVDGPPGLIEVKSADDLNQTTQFRAFKSPIETGPGLVFSHEFFCDGAGILIYGRSYPTIDNVTIEGNRGAICGGGGSVLHHLIPLAEPVRFTNCIFRDNHAAVSGSAIDVFFPGTWVEFDNCLFVGNVSNEKLDIITDYGFGAVSVFPGSKVSVNRCTFTDNWNAVDDRGKGSIYKDSIFWNNTRRGGIIVGKERFELDLTAPESVENCFIHGAIGDLRARVSRASNHFDKADPDFDPDFRPRNSDYSSVGYRPIHRTSR